MKKSSAIRQHFAGRVEERTDLSRKGLRKQISNSVRSGKCFIIEKQSNRVWLYGGVFNSERIIFAYDKNRKIPITVLPKDNKKYVYFDWKFTEIECRNS